jgi:hypothetical protein
VRNCLGDSMEIGSPEWDAMNSRRIDLIRLGWHRTEAEELEYESLQAYHLAEMRKAFPPAADDPDMLVVRELAKSLRL